MIRNFWPKYFWLELYLLRRKPVGRTDLGLVGDGRGGQDELILDVLSLKCLIIRQCAK